MIKGSQQAKTNLAFLLISLLGMPFQQRQWFSVNCPTTKFQISPCSPQLLYIYVVQSLYFILSLLSISQSVFLYPFFKLMSILYLVVSLYFTSRAQILPSPQPLGCSPHIMPSLQSVFYTQSAVHILNPVCCFVFYTLSVVHNLYPVHSQCIYLVHSLQTVFDTQLTVNILYPVHSQCLVHPPHFICSPHTIFQ